MGFMFGTFVASTIAFTVGACATVLTAPASVPAFAVFGAASLLCAVNEKKKMNKREGMSEDELFEDEWLERIQNAKTQDQIFNDGTKWREKSMREDYEAAKAARNKSK
jgi:hypothetical protein